MRMLCSMGLLGIVVAMASSQAPNDNNSGTVSPAQWLPASTMAYVEIPRPGQLAAALAHWVDGSCLADYPLRLPSLRAGNGQQVPGMPGLPPPNRSDGPDWLAPLAMMLTREGLLDAERLGPVAWACLDVTREGETREVYVASLGRSSILPSILRQHLLQNNAQPSETVDGVPTYLIVESPWEHARRWQRAYAQWGRLGPVPGAGGQAAAVPAVPQANGHQPLGEVYALLPDAIVMGSREAVHEVIRGHNGKRQGPSLAETAAFKDAARGTSSAFFVLQRTESGGLPPGMNSGWITRLANGKGSWSGQWNVQKDLLGLTAQVPPGAGSYLRQALSGSPVDQRLLHFAPPDALGVVALSMSNGQRQWEALSPLLDLVAPSGDTSLRALRQTNERGDARPASDVGGMLANLACVLPGRVNQSSPRALTWVLHAKTVDDAQRLTSDVLPKLLAGPGGFPMAPTVKEVDGVAVQLYDLGGGQDLAVGKHEAFVVIGSDTARVTASLRHGAKQQGWLADEKLRGHLQPSAGSTLVGAARTWPALLTLQSMLAPDGVGRDGPGIAGLPFARPNDFQAQPLPVPGGPGTRPRGDGMQVPLPPGAEATPDRAWQKLGEGSSEPLVFWVQGGAERWQVVAKLKNPKQGFASFAELWLAGADGQAGFAGLVPGAPGQVVPRMVLPGGGPQPAVPPPLPPPPDRK